MVAYLQMELTHGFRWRARSLDQVPPQDQASVKSRFRAVKVSGGEHQVRVVSLSFALVLAALTGFAAGCGSAPPKTVTAAPKGQLLVFTQMLSPTVGWGLDTSGQVVRTSDGGRRWVTVSTPAMAALLEPSTIHAGALYGGPSSESIAPSFLTGQIARIAVLSGPPYDSSGVLVFSTANGGGNWSEVKVAVPKSTTSLALSFPDARHGWLVGVEGGLAGSSAITIWRTSDGGQTWSQTSAETTFNPTGIGFLNDTEGWLAGTSPAFNHVSLAETTNAGVSWRGETLAIPRGNYVVTTYPPISVVLTTYPPLGTSGETAIMPLTLSGANSGKGGWVLFFRNSPSGLWQSLTPIAMPADLATALQAPVYSFYGSQDGWVLMPLGSRTGYATRNRGLTWSRWQAPIGHYLSLQFVSPEVGYLLAWQNGRGQFWKTVNGGATWIQVPYSIQAVP